MLLFSDKKKSIELDKAVFQYTNEYAQRLCQQDGRRGGALLVSSHSKNNWAATHGPTTHEL